MSEYFTNFPTIFYDIDKSKPSNSTMAVDIFRRNIIREQVLSNVISYYPYQIQSGERPDTLAHYYYGSVDFMWLILYANDIFDVYYDWPMSDQTFETFIRDKYSNPDGIHHYEVTTSSGKTTGDGPDDYSHKIEVNSDASGAQSVSNREFEQRLQDRKRLIKLLNPAYLNTFIQEFNNLVRN